MINQQEILLQPPHVTLFPHLSLKSAQVHPVPPSHVQCEPMLIHNSVLTPLLTACPAILSSNDRSNGNKSGGGDAEISSQNLLNTSRNDAPILLNSDSQLLNSSASIADPQIASKTQLLGSGAALINSGILQHSSNGNLINRSSQPPSPTLTSFRPSGSSLSQTGGQYTAFI